MKNPLIGVDVGGTYTDLIAIDPVTGEFAVAKSPSERGNEALGFMNGLQLLGDVKAFATIVHGTTVGTNALLERKGAKIGVITTAGFKDVLEMRRRDRQKTWGLAGTFTPVAERDMRLEVRERMRADGSIVTPLNAQDVREAVEQLLAQKAEAIAIIFIHAYANPEHEQAAFKIAKELAPHLPICISSELLPEIREFERASTTALNASLMPVVGNYLGRLETALMEHAFKGQFHIIQSNGGVMDTRTAREAPIKTALSGPAAGVIAAKAIAAAAGHKNIITGDLGGTSFDVSLIANGEVGISSQTTLDFGLVIRSPMIEITTIGAGGGSIAHLDAGGFLHIGPQSAGSRPGPACYDQGNTHPTLTDANLVLGRINAQTPIGGMKKFNSQLARNAIETHIATPLGLSIEAAAESIIQVADAKMAGAIRLVSIARGHNPNDFSLMPFGGGGALHAAALIEEIGLKSALVPPFPGVTSALGCVIADIRQDRVLTLNLPLATLNITNLQATMLDEAAKLQAAVEATKLPIEALETHFALDMLYQGQTHSVTVPIMAQNNAASLQAAFDKTYTQTFSRLLNGIPIQVVNLRVTVIGKRPPFDLRLLKRKTGSLEAAKLGTRQVWFNGAWHETQIYNRLSLPSGIVIKGAAIFEQSDATIILPPNFTAKTDELGNLEMSKL